MLKGLGCFKHAQNGLCVVALCRGKENERDFFAFVAIEPQNYGYFRKRYRDGEAASFNAYGFELLRGWGKEPAPEVTQYLQYKHGVEFGVSEEFLNRFVSNSSVLAGPLTRDWYNNHSLAHP